MADSHEKQAIALGSVAASLLLLTIKLAVGYQTNSLGILSEAAHSALDLLAAILTLLAVVLASRPADSDHHYGHGKVENMSALIETLLLLLTCCWIVHEAVQRLRGVTLDMMQPNIWAYGVMSLSMAIDIHRSRVLRAAAKRYSSQALEADSLHFASDILSSGVVILGLLATQIGQAHKIPWLLNADPIAALVVSVLIMLVSVRLGMRTVDALVDRAPEPLIPTIETAIQQVDDVLACNRVRVRTSGSLTFVELTLTVDRNLPLERTQAVIAQARVAMQRVIPGADVVVQLGTRGNPRETIEQRVRAAADHLKLSVHNIAQNEANGKLFLDMHLEVDGSLQLKSAHDLSNRLEERIRDEIPDIGDIVILIEGRRHGIRSMGPNLSPAAGLDSALTHLARSVPSVIDCRDLTIIPGDRSFTVTCRCIFPDAMPVETANRISNEIEHLWRAEEPRIGRITIHQEPASVIDVPPEAAQQSSVP